MKSHQSFVRISFFRVVAELILEKLYELDPKPPESGFRLERKANYKGLKCRKAETSLISPTPSMLLIEILLFPAFLCKYISSYPIQRRRYLLTNSPDLYGCSLSLGFLFLFSCFSSNTLLWLLKLIL